MLIGPSPKMCFFKNNTIANTFILKIGELGEVYRRHHHMNFTFLSLVQVNIFFENLSFKAQIFQLGTTSCSIDMSRGEIKVFNLLSTYAYGVNSDSWRVYYVRHTKPKTLKSFWSWLNIARNFPKLTWSLTMISEVHPKISGDFFISYEDFGTYLKLTWSL